MLILLGVAASAQIATKPNESPAVKAFTDSLANLSASYFAYFRLWDELDAPSPRRVRPNPAYYKLFVPPTYYEAPIAQAFRLNWYPGMHIPTAVDSLYAGKPDSITLFTPKTYDSLAKADEWTNIILRKFYLQHPEMLVNNELAMIDLKALDDDQAKIKPKTEKVKTLMETEKPVTELDQDSELLVVKPNFWTHKGNGSLQFTQNYISDNWYKGGESTAALLSGLVLEANYDDKQRLEFENKLEIKLGFLTTPSDTVHNYTTNADLLRLTSKLGVKAFTNWYYTLAAEFKTQFLPSYETNTNNMVSNFLSPAELDVTLGMDFKQTKKNYTLSLLTSPLAYTFVYISNDKIVDPTSFNVEEGHSTAHLLGSKFTGNLNWKIIPAITWESKLEYFTTYNKVIASWENTFNFAVNRYLSTKLFVHARFDDSVTLTDDNTSYFQLQELLSFGLSYTW